MTNKLQFKRAKNAIWENNADYILEEGEPAFIIDENELRIGDGNTPFSELQPIGGKPWIDLNNQLDYTSEVSDIQIEKFLSSKKEADRYVLYLKLTLTSNQWSIFSTTPNSDTFTNNNVIVSVDGKKLSQLTYEYNDGKLTIFGRAQILSEQETQWVDNKSGTGKDVEDAVAKYLFTIIEYTVIGDDNKYYHNIIGLDFFDSFNVEIIYDEQKKITKINSLTPIYSIYDM